MSESNQFYADNEKEGDGIEKNIDLSLAYEVKPTKISDDEWEDSRVGFFCHNCEQLVSVKKSEKRVKFTCGQCGKGDIAFGTIRSLTHHFRLNEQGAAKT